MMNGHPLFDPREKYPLSKQIAAVEREIEMRKKVYGRKFRRGECSREVATGRVDEMVAVLKTLQDLQADE